MWKTGTPIPYQGRLTPMLWEEYQKELADSTVRDIKSIHEDDWKWSIYLSRKVGNRFRFSLQFANDNLLKTKFMPPPPSQSKYTEVMRDTWMKDENGKEIFGLVKDWYWMARIMFYL